MCFILVLTAPAIVTAEEEFGPAIIVTNYIVDPPVLMPGDTGTITVIITNTAVPTIPTESTTTMTDQFSYFNLLRGEGSTTTKLSQGMFSIADIRSISLYGKEIKAIDGGSGHMVLGPAQSVMATFAIKASESADNGDYFPEIHISLEGVDNVQYSIPVKIDNSGVALLASDIPASIPIGRSSEIELGIVNMRPNPISSVRVSAQADGIVFTPNQVFVSTEVPTEYSSTPESTTSSLIPEDIYSSLATSTVPTTTVPTSTMAPYQVSTVKFNINPESTGLKDITFELEYKNGDNIHFEKLPVSLNVVDITDVKLVPMDLPKSVSKGEIVTLDFEVVNARPGRIVSVGVIPVTYNSVIPSERFIGTMESDDVFSASFDIDTEDLSPGDNDIGFKVIFRDEGSDRSYESRIYMVPITIIEEEPEDPWPLSIVPLALLPFVGGYYVYKHRERRRV
ncbi:MAG: hypothetical protein SVM80_01740 [Halobacteriota archaeon]|nr:hypothetical protein [Halobacteriota archaeon]